MNLKSFEADQADSFWRFALFFPVILNVIMLVNFLFGINAESIMFAIQHD